MNLSRFLPVLATTFVLGLQSAEARLGETLAQCEERYGPVVEKRAASVKDSDPDACVFSKSGVTAIIEFRQGIAWRLVFRLQGMTAMDVDTLLRANLPDGGWGPALRITGIDYRLSADRRRMAVATPARSSQNIGTLEVVSRDYSAARYSVYSSKVAEAVTKGVQERKTVRELSGF